LILVLDQFSRNLPFIFAFTGANCLSMAGAFLGISLSTFRRARTLTSTGQWKLLSVVVLRRNVYKDTTGRTSRLLTRTGH
jgi:hypothetical protein